MTINDGMPYDIVLWPASGTNTTAILPAYRDTGTTDPTKQMRVPTGIAFVMITNDSVFTLTLKMLRGGNERTVIEVPPLSTSSTQIANEDTNAEMWVMLSSTADVSQRIAYRIGVKVTPTPTLT